jgi:hypothetical protein
VKKEMSKKRVRFTFFLDLENFGQCEHRSRNLMGKFPVAKRSLKIYRYIQYSQICVCIIGYSTGMNSIGRIAKTKELLNGVDRKEEVSRDTKIHLK